MGETPIGERLASIEADVKTLVKGQDKLFKRLEEKEKESQGCREDLLERINSAARSERKLDAKTVFILLGVVTLSGGSAGAISELIAKLLGG